MSGRLPRIEALTNNARATWLVLLGTLVFMIITLMGVEDIDVWGVDRSTVLPLVGVSVPTRLFLVAAPFLIAAVYGHLHLYLIQLCRALGCAGAKIKKDKEDQQLSEAVPPWLVTDAILHFRQAIRQEDPPCISPRPMDRVATLLNVLLAWVGGVAVLAWVWWTSMVAHNLAVSLLAGALLLAASWIGAVSYRTMRREMAGPKWSPPNWLGRLFRLVMAVLAVVAVTVLTIERTTGRYGIAALLSDQELELRCWVDEMIGKAGHVQGAAAGLNRPQMCKLISKDQLWSYTLFDLEQIDLNGEALVPKPDSWLPHAIARRDFQAVWCKRAGAKVCEIQAGAPRMEFEAEWRARRLAEIDDFNALELTGANLTHADFTQAYLPGLDLEGANLTNGVLEEASAEGVKLRYVDMPRVDLRRASMEFADLFGAELPGAVLANTALYGADLTQADMRGVQGEGVNFSSAILKDARLEPFETPFAAEWADLFNSASVQQLLSAARSEDVLKLQVNFGGAQPQTTVATPTNLAGASADRADLTRADLTGANLSGSSLRGARLDGTTLNKTEMQRVDLSYAYLAGDENSVNLLVEADLHLSVAHGAAFRYLDLTEAKIGEGTDYRNVFLDGTTKLSDFQRRMMGWPCQWLQEPLEDDQAFHAHWRGWIEVGPEPSMWQEVAPAEWREVVPLPPTEGCTWKVDPLVP